MEKNHLIFLLTITILGEFQNVHGKKNVLMIVVDDLTINAVSTYKEADPIIYTPNIAGLASLSQQFNYVVSAQALCGPSRTALLTSRRPDMTRVISNGKTDWRGFGGNFSTLPQHFKENGYTTASVGKVFHPLKKTDDDYRYSWTYRPFHPETQEFNDYPNCPPDGKDNLICPVKVAEQPLGSLPDIESLQEAVRFLQFFNKTQTPFFLAVGFHKPHVPFRFPEEYLQVYPLEKVRGPVNPLKPDKLPPIAWNPWMSVRRRDDMAAKNLSWPYGLMDDLDTRRIRQSYYSAASYTDDQIGLLLEELVNLGLEENTLVTLFGDHGWQLGQHQEFAKFSNFQNAARVPWMISLESGLKGFKRVPVLDPRVETPKPKVENNNRVTLLDVFPTIAELSGLPKIPKCPKNSRKVQLCTDGYSRASGKLKGLDLAFYQYPRPSATPQFNSDGPDRKDIKFMGYSCLSSNYRFTEWVTYDLKTFKADWNDSKALELYDLKKDPLEDNNVASEMAYKTVVNTFKKLLRSNFKDGHLHQDVEAE